MDTKHPDFKIIEALGGPAAVCRLIGLDTKGGVQRVHNWESRGIPPRVRLDYPHIFSLASKIAAENSEAKPT